MVCLWVLVHCGPPHQMPPTKPWIQGSTEKHRLKKTPFSDPQPIFKAFFFLQSKQWWSLGRCRKCGDCPYKDLAKSGHKSNMKHKFLIIILYIFWLPIEAKYSNLATFPSSFFFLASSNWNQCFFGGQNLTPLWPKIYSIKGAKDWNQCFFGGQNLTPWWPKRCEFKILPFLISHFSKFPQ